MRSPFASDASGATTLTLTHDERYVLSMMIPALLDGDGDAGGRLDYTAHPDDPEAEERYRRLVVGDLDQLRRDDRSAFHDTVTGGAVTTEAVESFVRVVGEARLVLAARAGIEHDGWEEQASPDDPEVALLGWLGWLQDQAVRHLSDVE